MQQEGKEMSDVKLPVEYGPNILDEPILPGWQFSLFNVNVGHSSDSSTEMALIAKVGSYGKQIGHLAEALEIVISHLKLMDLPEAQLADDKKKVLRLFLNDVEAAGKIKHRRK